EGRKADTSVATTVVHAGDGDTGLVVASVALVVALACWLFGLPEIDAAAMDDLGLISVLPWPIWIAYLLLAGGFCVLLSGSAAHGRLPQLYLAAVVLLLHATPAIAYGTLRYSWAWKHLGIVDFIQRNGALDPDAPFLAAYHNWPAFFVAFAAIAEAFDLGTQQLAALARFFPTLLNLVYLLLLPPILRRFTTDPRLVWSAACLFVVGNWVGQDYFSPQGTAYAMYLAVLALCLGPLSTPAAAAVPGRRAGIMSRWFTWANQGVPRERRGYSPAARTVFLLSALLLIIAIAATHQLTPLLLIFAFGGLVLIGRLSLTFLLFALIAELLWLFYFADQFVSRVLSAAVADAGLDTQRLAGVVDLAVVSQGQRLVSIASRALTGAIALLAVLGGFRRLSAGYRDGPAIVLTLAPAPLLVATSYGGEIPFRLYFYALPFLAFFAAALFFPSPARGRSPIWRIALCGLLLACTFGFVLANNGKDRQYRFSEEEVAAATWLYETGPPGSLLVEGARNYPSQFRNYENFVYLPLADESAETLARVLADPVTVLGTWLADRPSGFVIITRSQKAIVESLGTMPPGTLDRIEQALTASPRFRVVYANPDARIFVLNPAVAGFRDLPAVDGEVGQE
ncbi:MAG TPA: hypothetical protein VIM98_09235, partial [Dyella sp.]|uniref:hypothetical protein n=1 Tax=Dyella sp. TaxID=1869338 RepID=UPI002F928E5E